MSRPLDVFLAKIRVGRLARDDRGRVSFRLSEEYRHLPDRPVLSQSFEDDLSKTYRGRRDELPSFFANLIPEGPLRSLLESSLDIPQCDDMALLAAVGSDLPGAVEIRPGLEGDWGEQDPGNGDEEEFPTTEPSQDERLRFSLAGVQLKFSVLREGERLTLPVHGKTGDWIVKLDSSHFSKVVENEFATLEWARASGFEVPECHLVSSSALAPPLARHVAAESAALLIRRYDREEDRRLHQEDFAQVVGLPPRLKYDQKSYEQLAILAKGIAGPEACQEFLRRVAFVVASGNTDAHLKNWSLLYPDGVNAVLSPLYDQVSTVVWPELQPELSLKLMRRKSLRQIDESILIEVAVKTGESAARATAHLRDCLQRIAEAWRESAGPRMPPEHASSLRSYWNSSPLLRPYADHLRS